MDLMFDDEQELFKRSARKFLETYCDKSVVRELEAGETGFSPDLWKGMAELGWMGAVIPEAYGGLLLMTYVVVVFSIAVQGLTIAPLLRRLGHDTR